MHWLFSVIFGLLYLRMHFVCAGLGGSVNLTDFVRHRQKRFLIFQDSGTIKLSAGPALPLNFGDYPTWRGITISYNVQGGTYPLPTEPLYPWDKWEDIFARSIDGNLQAALNRTIGFREDDSRLFVYILMEKFMNRQHGNGRACLLRSICENAQVNQHVGILAEIMNVVLTPGKETLHPIYKQAHIAGRTGVDCLKLYAECPEGVNFLDQYFQAF